MKVVAALGALVLTFPVVVLVGVGVLLAPSGACPIQGGPPAAVPGDMGTDGIPPTGRGQSGSGVRLGQLPTIQAAPAQPYAGTVTAAVANLPTTHRGPGSLPTVPGSLRAMTAGGTDFVALNEVSRATSRFLMKSAPGYGAYKDPLSDRGSANSLGSAVLWNTSAWTFVDGGRFKYVEHDLAVFQGRPVDWNRYATWTVLKHNSDGRQVVVIATHHMTNPQQQPRTHGDYAWPSRIAQYEYGMRLLRQLVAHLAPYGTVLLAGDMNVFARQGTWSAPEQMADAGFRHTSDDRVIYQFFPAGSQVIRRRLVPVSSDHPNALLTTLELGGTAPATTPAVLPNPLPQIDGFSPEQVRNAATIITAGTRLGIPPRGIKIALMTAYGESRLRNLPYGDRDSLGLFQQRDNGAWGTTADRMNPDTAATNFFNALLKVPRWRNLKPTLAAHAVQANADPDYYQTFWHLARRLYDVIGPDPATPSAFPAGCPPASGPDGTTGFTASGVAYVGPYPPAELMARAQAFVAARTYDPFFHTVDGSWYRLCQHFAANLSGRANSGYTTAAAAWAQFVATNVAHAASAADGHSPPVGAWLYYRGRSPEGHVAVYLGHGLIATTDLPRKGAIGIVPASAPTTEWNQTYLGWATPWGLG